MRRYIERDLWCYRLEVCTEVGCLPRPHALAIQRRIVERLFPEQQRRYDGGIALPLLTATEARCGRARNDCNHVVSSWRSTSGLFLLAMSGHAGPICKAICCVRSLLAQSGHPRRGARCPLLGVTMG